MVQGLRTLVALVEAGSSVSSIQIGWLTTTCNLSSRGFNAYFMGTFLGTHRNVHVHTCAHTHTFKILKKFDIKLEI